jgi:hypothetical protein
MKRLIILAIMAFALTACDPVEPVNTALSWTVEEQCQTWNKWTVKVEEILPIGIAAPLTYTLDAMDPEYFQHPPILMTDKITGQKIAGGICPDAVIRKVYGYYND